MTNNVNISILNIPASVFHTAWEAAINNAPKKIDMQPSETIDLDWNDLPDNGQRVLAESLTAFAVSACFIQYEKQHGTP